jgi:transcriptional regulator with XRE-family HTH domain
MLYVGHMSQAAYETGSIPPETLGWRLQRTLSFADVSVEQMSTELGVSRSTVSRWLNDRGTPSLGYLKIWALRCGVPFGWLMGDENPGRTNRDDITTIISSPGDTSGDSPSSAEIAALTKRLPLTRGRTTDSSVRAGRP